MPGFVYQSVEFAVPLITATPLLMASASNAATSLSLPTTMAMTFLLPTRSCSAACALAGSPPSSSTYTLTAWPLMPPLAFTHASHAGATVAAWSLEDACEPDRLAMTPTLMTEPVGAAAAVVAGAPALVELPPVAAAAVVAELELLLLLLLHAPATSAAMSSGTGTQRPVRRNMFGSPSSVVVRRATRRAIR